MIIKSDGKWFVPYFMGREKLDRKRKEKKRCNLHNDSVSLSQSQYLCIVGWNDSMFLQCKFFAAVHLFYFSRCYLSSHRPFLLYYVRFAEHSFTTTEQPVANYTQLHRPNDSVNHKFVVYFVLRTATLFT